MNERRSRCWERWLVKGVAEARSQQETFPSICTFSASSLFAVALIVFLMQRPRGLQEVSGLAFRRRRYPVRLGSTVTSLDSKYQTLAFLFRSCFELFAKIGS